MEEYNVNGEPAKRRDCVKRDQPDKINVVAAFVSISYIFRFLKFSILYLKVKWNY